MVGRTRSNTMMRSISLFMVLPPIRVAALKHERRRAFARPCGAFSELVGCQPGDSSTSGPGPCTTMRTMRLRTYIKPTWLMARLCVLSPFIWPEALCCSNSAYLTHFLPDSSLFSKLLSNSASPDNKLNMERSTGSQAVDHGQYGACEKVRRGGLRMREQGRSLTKSICSCHPSHRVGECLLGEVKDPKPFVAQVGLTPR